jgi:hypothetical protein
MANYFTLGGMGGHSAFMATHDKIIQARLMYNKYYNISFFMQKKLLKTKPIE